MKVVKKIHTSDKHGNRLGCVVVDLAIITSMTATPAFEHQYVYEYKGHEKKLVGENEVELNSVEVELYSEQEINPSGYQVKRLSFHCTQKQADTLADELVDVLMGCYDEEVPKKKAPKKSPKKAPKK